MHTRLLTSAAVCALAGAGMAQAQDRTVLPIPRAPFDGQIAENIMDARPGSARPVQAPVDAPNIFLVMSDDVGFAMSSAFGGPVPTPNYERLAARGQRYNRFHTTGICSPSRAALLTGRNHHKAGVGYLSDLPSSYPGYGGRIRPETATIAQMLRMNGYSTAMWGKHHNVPGAERSEAGPFDAWPTGLGFDYFLGFPYGDSDQFQPILYRGISRIPADEGNGKMLEQRMADDIMRWIHNQKAAAPSKPFLAYYAPGSTHAPHQAPPEWIARFRGAFDQGWDRMREETYKRQLSMGIIPKGTKLTPRPAEIPAWESLNGKQKAFAARAMEVAAAQLAFQDAQVGRVLDELDRMGLTRSTLIAIVQGDNGASAESGPKGTIDELRSMGTHDEREEWLLENTDRLGGPMTYENYPGGWSWAMNTPLRWVKQHASMLGGVRNGMILSWQGHVAHPGSICARFSHLVDFAPTLLEAAALPMPTSVNGVRQDAFDGRSLLPSLTTCDPAEKRTQYFEIGGKFSLYHDGWYLSGDNGRPAWDFFPPGGMKPQISYSLYDLSKDFSQSTDLAARFPAKLAEMKALWEEAAKANNVYPLDHRFAGARIDPRDIAAARAGQPKRYDFWGKDISIPTTSPALPVGRSFTVAADLVLDKPDASGAIMAVGSRFGGWSLFLDKGRPSFVWARSTDPTEIQSARSERPLPSGPGKLELRFAINGAGKGAEVTLTANGADVTKVSLPVAMLMPAGGGETIDIGRDLGVPVVDYGRPHGAIEGDVPHVTITFD